MSTKYNIEELEKLKEHIISQVKKHPEDINKLVVDTDKRKLLESETTRFDMDNVSEEIKKIASSIPDDIDPIDKVRWVYMKLGELFSYDYRVVNDFSYATREYDLNGFTDRYETCVQISSILNGILNKIEGVKSEILPRVTDSIRGVYGEEHYANDVEVEVDGFTERYILDLTLDLYLIQSRCKTEHFGYESGQFSEYDIIAQPTTREIDKKLGLSNGEYLNTQIEELSDLFNSNEYKSMSDEERIDNKIAKIMSITPKIRGYHELLQITRKIFSQALHENYKEFTLYCDRDGNTNMKTCYRIDTDTCSKTYVLMSEIGFLPIKTEQIDEMMGDNWKTRSISMQ